VDGGFSGAIPLRDGFLQNVTHRSSRDWRRRHVRELDEDEWDLGASRAASVARNG
jgi:hypothetical protein